jgi:hypothetical protein
MIIDFFLKRIEARKMSDSKQMLFARNLICVCVDDDKDADYQGLIYHQYADEPISFNGIADMILEMENLFDEWDFPQRGLAERKFDKKKENHKRPVPETEDDKLKIEIISDTHGVRNVQNKKGKLATFVIQVVYRQDASWQGHVIYQEDNEKLDFNSALELIKIIDRAVTK